MIKLAEFQHIVDGILHLFWVFELEQKCQCPHMLISFCQFKPLKYQWLLAIFQYSYLYTVPIVFVLVLKALIYDIIRYLAQSEFLNLDLIKYQYA